MHICILSISTSSDPVNKHHKTAQKRFMDLLVPLLPKSDWASINCLEDNLTFSINEFDAYLITGGKYSVFENVLNQRLSGNDSIIGVMIESHLNSGKQTLNESKPQSLKYGISITDSCLGWKHTEELLLDAYGKLS